MDRVERQVVQGYTSTALVAEAVHKIMLAEAVQQYSLPDKGIVTRLKEKPEQVKGLTHMPVTEDFEKMNISIEVVTADLIKEAERLFAQHGLLTNDSITLALMKRLGLTDLATNDDDFDDVSWVTVWKPR
jgi:predicted nucleic acid-binding protein